MDDDDRFEIVSRAMTYVCVVYLIMALFAALLLFFATPTRAAELVVHGVSKHYGQRHEWLHYNEANYGLGVRLPRSETLAYQVGAYKNTQGRGSAYVIADYTPWRVGPLQFGGFAGVATGYSAYLQVVRADGSYFVERSSAHAVGVAGLVLRLPYLAVRIAPPIKDKNAGAVALELVLPL